MSEATSQHASPARKLDTIMPARLNRSDGFTDIHISLNPVSQADSLLIWYSQYARSLVKSLLISELTEQF